jgi:hypothetical protein
MICIIKRDCALSIVSSLTDSLSFFFSTGHKGKQTNLISAMIKYGTDKKRFVGMTKEDLEFANNGLDLELMQLFQYEMPTL